MNSSKPKENISSVKNTQKSASDNSYTATRTRLVAQQILAKAQNDTTTVNQIQKFIDWLDRQQKSHSKPEKKRKSSG